MKVDWDKVKQDAELKEDHQVKEELMTQRIVKYIILGLVALALVVGLGCFWYYNDSLKAVNHQKTETVQVTIPIGSSSKDIARLLKSQGLIKNADIFSFYMKAKSVNGLQAGHYDLSPSMDADTIIATLQKGGKPIEVDVDTKLTVVEGMQLEQIAQMVEENTPIKAADFLATANDASFIEELKSQYPSLISGLDGVEGLKYKLEGYLYPATYDYIAGTNVKDLIKQMVGKMNLEYQKLKEDMGNTSLSFHQILTLASIIEKEGVTDEDRKLISGVFYNRMNNDMPLQSDITVLYALGEHKELVTIKDTEVDSPYNLYKHTGLGPGPYNSPSLSAIQAAIYPTASDYFYFVADIETGNVYYATTLEEHEALVAKYVNKNSSQESSLSSSETE
ncbi:endolytic transglycosylase MltG [uncultured Abiotrophia sp.]|uniref:endolytic transglycosylase MltG n=1 Tax=uncultured Abiotrophia sp. TaxID=316094 RepID=UPI00262D32DB|nr:endolytic transglycosylase MltG [uncultured Abiotrophia sp.]